MSGLLLDHVGYSIDLLRHHEPPDGYYLAFSGGKDSCVIKHLAQRAGVKFDAHYSVCPDPPELQRFIREHHFDVVWERPRVPFFTLVSKWGMPTPKMRLCCSEFKERGGKGRTLIIGVRQAESPRRAEAWIDNQPGYVAPIVSWSDAEVWNFIHAENLPYCSLYDEGFSRIGCVGCPLASQRLRDRDFRRFPRFERAWMRACWKLWRNHRDDDEWICRQRSAGYYNWLKHWQAWRYDLRGFQTKRREAALCGDLWLDRYQQ